MHSVCGATSGVVRVHHHHVLIRTKLGQALSVVVRMHTVILSTSRHGLSLQIRCFSFRMSHVSNMRVQVTPDHHAASGRCGVYHFVSPIVQFVCRPVVKWWRTQAQSARGPTSTFLPLWFLPFPVRQLVERPLRGCARFRRCPVCNNETCMSICPSSHPVAPLGKSCIQPAHF